MHGIGHALDIARHRLAIAVRQEGGDTALVHPGNGVDGQAGLAFARRRVFVAPRPKRHATLMVACAEDEYVTLAEPDALGRLDGLELGPVDRLARLEPIDAAVAGRIEEHAAPDNAGRVGGDVAPVRAARGQRRYRLAIV